MNKKNKLIYTVTTSILALLYLGGGARYFIEYDIISDIFADLGYPRYLQPYMGASKLMATAILLAPVPKWLKEFTYSGIFINASLAFLAHMMVDEPFSAAIPAIIAILLVIISRIYWGKLQYLKSPFKISN